MLLEQQQDRAKREQERIRLLTADPFDLEAQAKIEEDIRYGVDTIDLVDHLCDDSVLLA